MTQIEEEEDTNIEEAISLKEEDRVAVALICLRRDTSAKDAKSLVTSSTIVPRITIRITTPADIRECLSPPSINSNS
jgi:hypothetical protein